MQLWGEAAGCAAVDREVCGEGVCVLLPGDMPKAEMDLAAFR